jgi:hypothetical protein
VKFFKSTPCFAKKQNLNPEKKRVCLLVNPHLSWKDVGEKNLSWKDVGEKKHFRTQRKGRILCSSEPVWDNNVFTGLRWGLHFHLRTHSTENSCCTLFRNMTDDFSRARMSLEEVYEAKSGDENDHESDDDKELSSRPRPRSSRPRPRSSFSHSC